MYVDHAEWRVPEVLTALASVRSARAAVSALLVAASLRPFQNRSSCPAIAEK
jgi:hypothetical protein